MLNEVTIIGNAGRDAEPRDDQSFLIMSVATNESYKQEDDTWKEETVWHNVKFSNYLFEKAKRIKKGDTLVIKGKFKSYEKEGVRIWQVVAFKLYNLSERNRSML